jgi:hypothetical protein
MDIATLATLDDRNYRAGLAEATLPYVQFGAHFIDYDLDGWVDLDEAWNYMNRKVTDEAQKQKIQAAVATAGLI